MKNGDGACYVWNGNIAKRGANEIGSCLLNFLHTYFNGTAESPSKMIFYTDNCAGQNKNKFITSLYICIDYEYSINPSRISYSWTHSK
jgi:hypothetical protein